MLAPRRSIILPIVKLRRLLQFLLLVALVVAPFGRMGTGEAKALPHHDMSAMAPHCPGPPPSDEDRGNRMAVDCMIACAAMSPAAAPFFAPPPAAEAAPTAMPASILAGIRPEADPPPPRLS